LYGRKVLNYLRDNKNYIVTSIITDTTGCSTVSQIYDLNCLTDHIKLGDRIDLLLLISIDEYVHLMIFLNMPMKLKFPEGYIQKR